MKLLQIRNLLSALLIFAFAYIASAQTTTFTYQGRLTDASAQANGAYDLGFALFDAATSGAQIGAAQTRAAVNVSNGVFTVQLDFGANPFASGANRFLEIAVKRPADAAFTTLTPRQQLTASPFSIQSLSATTANGLSAACVACVTNAQIASVDGAKVTGTVANATNAANAATANTANTATTAGNVTGVVAIANGGTGSATKNFVDLTTAQTIAGAKTFSDNLRASGLMRVGSETGTTNAPFINNGGSYDGLVVRRINSLAATAGNVAARTNYLRLERDGSNGGWRIANDALPEGEVQTVHCLGFTNSGTILTVRITLSTGTAAGTNQLFTDAQNIEYMQCSFGNTYYPGHTTQVTVQRYSGDYVWVGTVTSTFNQ